MLTTEDRATQYIIIIIFGSMFSSIVSASWMLNASRHPIAYFVLVMYIAVMLAGTLATILAYCKSSNPTDSVAPTGEPSPPPTTTPNYKSAYIQIGGMMFFLLGLMTYDLLTIIDRMHCLQSFLEFKCDVGASMLWVTMLAVRLVYVGAQVLYILVVAPRIRHGQARGLHSGAHLINSVINVGLLIHQLLYESRIVFNDALDEQIVCETATNKSWGSLDERCFARSTHLAALCKSAEPILHPMITEYLFLATSVLFGQWKILADAEADDRRRSARLASRPTRDKTEVGNRRDSQVSTEYSRTPIQRTSI